MKIKPWHHAVLGLLLLAGIGYALLPRGWALTQWLKPTAQSDWLTRTRAGIAGDPINIALQGDAAAVRCAFQRIQWLQPAKNGFRADEGIVKSVILSRPDPNAPVSQLRFEGRAPDLAFEHQAGASARSRDHIRLWTQDGAPGWWIGAVSFDARAGIDHETLRPTHHIDPFVDHERDKIAASLIAIGATDGGTSPGRGATQSAKNGSGDRYQTDGLIRRIDVRQACQPRP